MLCPQCGKELAEGIDICPSCGAEIDKKENVSLQNGSDNEITMHPTVEEMITGKKRPRKVKLGWIIAAAIIVIVSIGGIAYYNKWYRSASLETLIPQDCAIVASADASWWWSALEDVRQETAIQNAIKFVEKEGNISFDKDVVPWMGQMGIAMLDVSADIPQIVLLAEIRDEDAFSRCVKQVESSLQKRSNTKWTTITYDGRELRRIRPYKNLGPNLSITIGIIGGWLVFGIGDGSAEKVIDVWHGRVPSLEDDSSWSRALDKKNDLPTRPVLWLGTNNQSFMRVVANISSRRAVIPRNLPRVEKVVFIGTVSESIDQMRFDLLSSSDSQKVRDSYKSIKDQSAKIDGRSIKEIPSDAFAVFIGSKPGHWMKMLKDNILESSKKNLYARQQYEMMFNELQPLQEALDKCTGECALGLNWRDGLGLGLVLLGETKDAKDAQYASGLLKRLANRAGVNMQENTDMVELPDMKQDKDNFHFLPCWGHKDQWLTFSTNPKWFTNNTKCSMCLPEDIEGSQFAGVGNFEFLPSVLDWADKSSPNASTKDFTNTIRQIELDKAEWVFWSKIDSDACSSHSVVILKNWSWRKTLQTLMQSDHQ